MSEWYKLKPVLKSYLLLPAAAFVLLFSSFSAWSATTGAGPSNLITIQGNGARCSFGDFYSNNGNTGCTNTALNSYYSYWIEVPASAGDVTVQFWDMDIGSGTGTTGDNDRLRYQR